MKLSAFRLSVASTDIGRESDPLVSRLERVSLSLSLQGNLSSPVRMRSTRARDQFCLPSAARRAVCRPLSPPTSPHNSLFST